MKGNSKVWSKRQGLFDHETLKVEFGHTLSKPENRFFAEAIKVPDYNYTVRERSDEGGGCYGSMELNEYTEKNEYMIVRDGVLIGLMKPYHKMHNIKSDLWEYRHINPRIVKLCKEHNIEIKPFEK